MDDTIPGFITGLATLVAAIGAVLVGWRNSKKADAAKQQAITAAAHALRAKEAAEASQRDIVATKDGVFEVGQRIDGRLSQLLELTRSAAFEAGRKAEGEDQDKKTDSVS